MEREAEGRGGPGESQEGRGAGEGGEGHGVLARRGGVSCRPGRVTPVKPVSADSPPRVVKQNGETSAPEHPRPVGLCGVPISQTGKLRGRVWPALLVSG